MVVWEHVLCNAHLLPQTQEEMRDLEAEPESTEDMQVDGQEPPKCSLRKAEPFSKRTGIAQVNLALLLIGLR